MEIYSVKLIYFSLEVDVKPLTPMKSKLSSVFVLTGNSRDILCLDSIFKMINILVINTFGLHSFDAVSQNPRLDEKKH